MIIISGIAYEIWNTLVQAAPYIIFGLVFSALIHILISPEKIVSYLGKNNFRSVIYAALFGIPLPLCSCSVVPTALTLRKKGASTGATTAFLISTPETGVDSILLTYGLMGWPMAVIRPVAAFMTSVLAGVTVNIMSGNEPQEIKDQLGCEHCNHDEKKPLGFFGKLKSGLRYSFVDLLNDTAPWFVIGIIIAGVISYLIPADIVQNYLGHGIGPKLIVLMVGIPMYICASASTPIVAALMLKGMSPGTAIVFLLSGPATNMASIIVISSIIGKRATGIYLASITICSFIAGILVDYIFMNYPLLQHQTLHAHSSEIASVHQSLFAIVLMVFLGLGLWRRYGKMKGLG